MQVHSTGQLLLLLISRQAPRRQSSGGGRVRAECQALSRCAELSEVTPSSEQSADTGTEQSSHTRPGHGQGGSQAADWQHEAPVQDGALAPLQINTGVSQEHLVSRQASIFWVKETHQGLYYRYHWHCYEKLWLKDHQALFKRNVNERNVLRVLHIQ